MEDYLQLLEESLIKKLAVLDEIEKFNLKQRDLFTSGAENPDFEKFDEYIAEKDRLIKELNGLDNGFETLYSRVEETLKGNKEAYADRIKRLQDLIRKVTGKSASLQAQEEENRQLIENFFKSTREVIGKGRASLNVAYSYLQSRGGAAAADSLFIDSKQ